MCRAKCKRFKNETCSVAVVVLSSLIFITFFTYDILTLRALLFPLLAHFVGVYFICKTSSLYALISILSHVSIQKYFFFSFFSIHHFFWKCGRFKFQISLFGKTNFENRKINKNKKLNRRCFQENKLSLYNGCLQILRKNTK